MRKLFATKLSNWNLIKGINNLTVPVCKILGTILEMDKRRTETQMEQRTRQFNNDAYRLTSKI